MTSGRVAVLTELTKAVFLSYASQDAEAAQHLCDALRAAGAEVWFDRNELRGGDAWDAAIRQQIKTCTLFVPMISANTQAREEGYFRREWKLAVDRTHDMAGRRTFLLPVVIDGTADLDALVPDKFREVQWSRLPAGTNPETFVAHVCRLLSPQTATAKERAAPLPGSSAVAAPAQAKPPISRSFAAWMVGGVLILTAGYFVADKFLASSHTVPAAETMSGKSIAVLPFADMSEKKDQEYFSDGLAEELIELIGKTPGLKVIARTSSFSFKNKSDDIASIASKLNVANVLEGSVRRSGDQLRVSTQLIRADSGQPIWSETFDREFKDIFKIQDEIATAVVSALKIQLTGKAGSPRGPGTANPQAYSAFLLGRQLHRQRTLTGWRQAIEEYQKAISLDPRYAEAYAALALSEYYVSDMGDPALAKSAEQAAQRAIDLDPQLAEGYSVRGLLRSRLHFDWAGAAEDDQRALTLEPSSRVLTPYGLNLKNVGRMEEAAATLRKSIEQDPVDDTPWTDLASTLTAMGNYAEAYDAFRHALAIRSTSLTNFNLAILQLLDGKALDAMATSQEIKTEGFRNAAVAMAQHTLGDANASDKALDQLIATDAGDGAYQIAEVYAWRGEKDKAFEWLERAYRQHDGGIDIVKIDPQLASLRADPRYTTLLRKLNFAP